MCLVSNSSVEIDILELLHGNDDRAVVDLRALKWQVSGPAAMDVCIFVSLVQYIARRARG